MATDLPRLKTRTDGLALIRHEGDLHGLREVAEASDGILCEILAVTGGNPLTHHFVLRQTAPPSALQEPT